MQPYNGNWDSNTVFRNLIHRKKSFEKWQVNSYITDKQME
jgi:hypothetical protein